MYQITSESFVADDAQRQINREWRRAKAAVAFCDAINGTDFSRADNRVSGGIELTMSLRAPDGIWHSTERTVDDATLRDMDGLNIMPEEFMAQLVISMRRHLENQIAKGN